ncbi:MAG: response regulator [Phycisphaerae bacterium]|jgi:DNA-binding response OmpR family regulator
MAKIVVVDDEPAYRAQLERLLRRAGHDVQAVESAEAALRAARECSPDVVVADWMLKNELTGLDVIKQLQAEQPGLATIIVTGYPAEGLQAEVRELTGATVLDKPFEARQLLDAVDEALRGTISKG